MTKHATSMGVGYALRAAALSGASTPFPYRDWKLSSQSGTQFAMQTSTNLTDWATLFKVTNNGSVCTYLNANPASANLFYRLIPSE